MNYPEEVDEVLNEDSTEDLVDELQKNLSTEEIPDEYEDSLALEASELAAEVSIED